MTRKLIKICLVLFCMGIIFYFSSDNGEESTLKSDGIIVSITEFLLNKKMSSLEKKHYIDRYVLIVRKGAHFSIYFLLGFLFSSLLKEYSIISYKSIIYTSLFVFFYACSDEVHQLFVSGRACEILDVLLDTLGGVCASFVYLFLYNLRRYSHE